MAFAVFLAASLSGDVAGALEAVEAGALPAVKAGLRRSDYLTETLVISYRAVSYLNVNVVDR